MKRLQIFLMIVGLALLLAGCQSVQHGAPQKQTTDTNRHVPCERQLQEAQEQIQDLTNEIRVTYMELEQEQVKVDALIDENQNLSEQLQEVMKHLLATESKPSAPETAPVKP